MPERTPNEQTKNIITNRMRRHDKTNARRVRLLPSDMFGLVAGHDKIKKGVTFEETRLSLLLTAKNINDKYTSVSRLLSGTPPTSIAHETEQLKSSLERVQTIASILSQYEAENDDSLSQFLSLDESTSIIPDAIPSLARKIGAMSQKEHLNGADAQAYVKKALLCLREADNAISNFQDALRRSPHFRLFNQPGCALISIPDEWASVFSEKTLIEALGIDQGGDAIFISNEFKEGAALVLYSSLHEHFYLNADGLDVEINDKQLSLLGHEGFDELLSSPVEEGHQHPLHAITKELGNNLPLSPIPGVNVTLADLDFINKLNIECRVSHRAEKQKQMPAFITLNKNMSGLFEDRQKNRSLHDIADLSDASTLIINEDKNVTLTLSKAQIMLIKRSEDEVVFKVSQNNPGDFVLERSLSPVQHQHLITKNVLIDAPDPAALKRKDAVKQSITPLKDKGYISQVYQDQSLKSILSVLEGPQTSLHSTMDGLSSLLAASNAKTLVDIRFDKEAKSQCAPYHASMTLFSLTEKGPHVRSVNALIEGNVTTATLQSLGLSHGEFKQHAMSLSQAESMFSKALSNASNAGRVTGMIRNAKSALSSISPYMPSLVKKLQALPILDPLALTKGYQLGRRTDSIFPLYIDRNGGRPVYFSDTPGSEVGVRGLLSRKATRTLSDDGNFALVADGDTVYLHDFEANGYFEWGELSKLSQQLHSYQQPCNAQHTDGDEISFVRAHQVTNLLRRNQTSDSINNVKFITPPALIQSLSPAARETFNHLAQHWDELQNNFDFSLSIKDNLDKSPFADSLNTLLAGGTGSQKGKRFLQRLYRQSQPYFFAATSGKKIDIALLLTQENPAMTLSASDASLTVMDILSANLIALQAKNPEIVNHYQKQKHANQILPLLEPNTVKSPAAVISMLAKEYGYQERYIEELYQAAYLEKDKSSGMFQSFLHESSALSLGGARNIIYPISLASALKAKRGDALDHTLKQHIQTQMCKLGTLDIVRPVRPNITFIDTPGATRNQLICEIEGDTTGFDIPAFAALLDDATIMMHLNNGIGEVKNSVDEAHTLNVEDKMIAHLNGSENIISQLNSTLIKHKLSASFIPNDAAMQSFAESILLTALGLKKKPPFNRTFTPQDLEVMKQHGHDVLARMELGGITLEGADHQIMFDHLVAQATTQYNSCQSLIKQVKGEARAFLQDDNNTQKKGLIDLANRIGLPISLTTTKDAITHFVDANKKVLPDRVISDLTRASLLKEAPEQGSEAKVYYQEILKQYRNPVNTFSVSGPARFLLDSFTVRNVSPVDSMLDNEVYQKFLDLNTPKRNDESPAIKPAVSLDKMG